MACMYCGLRQPVDTRRSTPTQPPAAAPAIEMPQRLGAPPYLSQHSEEHPWSTPLPGGCPSALEHPPYLPQYSEDDAVTQDKELVAEAQLLVEPTDKDELGGPQGHAKQHGPPAAWTPSSVDHLVRASVHLSMCAHACIWVCMRECARKCACACKLAHLTHMRASDEHCEPSDHDMHKARNDTQS